MRKLPTWFPKEKQKKFSDKSYFFGSGKVVGVTLPKKEKEKNQTSKLKKKKMLKNLLFYVNMFERILHPQQQFF